jgi:hypothetical protein
MPQTSINQAAFLEHRGAGTRLAQVVARLVQVFYAP